MSDLLNQIRSMSSEEKAELAAALKDLEPKPVQEAKQLGEHLDRRPRGDRGELLSPEEAWDRDHPLSILPYCYTRTEDNRFTGGKLTVRRFTKKEINEHNAEQLQIWLKAKREVFPDCLEPKINPESGTVKYLYR